MRPALRPSVEIAGERKHVMTYLGEFLFSSRRAGTPVEALSGGERNRLLLARLFARPANLLVLDEPTNDLDIESLELLEQGLVDVPGALLLVSHDRAFGDNVVTQTLAPLGDGRWQEYVGGYAEWLAQRPEPVSREAKGGAAAANPGVAPAGTPAPRARTKLSYKEQRELEALPGEIEALESEQKALTERMSAGDYHLAGAGRIAQDGRRLAEIEELLLAKLERWETLEAEAARLGGPR